MEQKLLQQIHDNLTHKFINTPANNIDIFNYLK